MKFVPFFSRAATAVVVVMVMATGSLAQAADFWTQVTSGSGTTSLTGTLGSVGVTMSSSRTVITDTPNINPGYNEYDIWDNDAFDTTTASSPNSARIYPASAKGNRQFVAAPDTTPSLITLTFSEPVLNPRVLVYSLDNSFVDFSATTNTGGQPAVASAVTNNSALFSGLVLDRLPVPGIPSKEGCANTTPPNGRGCGVVQFVGSYTTLQFTMQATSFNDGVGFQVGYASAPVTATSVPALGAGGVLALGALLAFAAPLVLRRRQRTAP